MTDDIDRVSTIGKPSGGSRWKINTIRLVIGSGFSRKTIVVAIISQWISKDEYAWNLLFSMNPTNCLIQTQPHHATHCNPNSHSQFFFSKKQIRSMVGKWELKKKKKKEEEDVLIYMGNGYGVISPWMPSFKRIFIALYIADFHNSHQLINICHLLSFVFLSENVINFFKARILQGSFYGGPHPWLTTHPHVPYVIKIIILTLFFILLLFFTFI